MPLIPKSFVKKLSLAYLLFFSLVFAGTAFTVSRALTGRALHQLRASLVTQTRLLRHVFTPALIQEGDRPRIHKLARELGEAAGARITVIRADGLVLGDSEGTWEELLRMDLHREEPEIREALSGETGSSVRYSNTVKKQMLYMALPLEEGDRLVGVLRVVLPLTEADEILSSVQKPVLIGSLLGILCILLVVISMSRRLSRHVSDITQAAVRYGEGDLDQKLALKGDDEFNLLADTLNRMASQLKWRISEIESEKMKLSAILGQIAEAVVAVDGKNQVIMLNSAAETLFGVAKGEAHGRSLVEVARSTEVNEMMKEAIEKQALIAREIEFPFPERRVLKASAIGVSPSEGGLGGILVLYDITGLRRLENMRKDFVANVSHELRTPITSIRGFIETLREGAMEEPERSREFLKMMQEDAERLTRLIDDLLELSKIESREVPLKAATLDLQEEVERALTLFQGPLQKKRIKVENQIPRERNAMVLADRDRLKQVLINLIDNAVKFNREGGHITLKAAPVGNEMRISIEDTGAGIPEKAIPRIFERFFRMDKARSRGLGGTGLGLAIVKHIVEAHGGIVSCESQPGRGSVFSFTLPMPSVPSASTS